MPPKAHADLSASSAYRWMVCPGSVQLSQGMPDKSSPYAREGTAAHTLMERSLSKKLDPHTWLDTEIAVPYKEDGYSKLDHVTVTEEMCDAVKVAVDEVWRRITDPQDKLFLEQKFDLAPLNPPGPMFGTADIVIWKPRDKKLIVIDLKYGAGVAVDATENSQLLFYGLGAVVALNVAPEEIELVIVQPRAYHKDGIVRPFHLNFETLRFFKRELFAAGAKTLLADAPLVAGDHCRFCKAQAVCPAQRQLAVETAQSEFDAIDEPSALPAPAVLSVEQLSRILAVAPTLQEWLRSVEQYLVNKLDRGEEVPGWKLVPKRASRKWKDEGEVIDALTEMGLEDDSLYVRKLVSPAQAEKALKAIKVKPQLDELVERVSSGSNLVPDSDPRPALLPSAASDFADTPNAA